MQSIATATKGAYKQINDASGLTGIFTEFASVFGDDGTDTDSDGLTDCQEINGVYLTSLDKVVTTDPKNNDTDGDGIVDGAETGLPVKTSINNKSPWTAPGYSNPEAGKADSDADGLSDPEEFVAGTNPLLADSDGDSLSDSDEIRKYETNPILEDTDGDGLNDNVELARASEGFDPNVFDYKVNSSFRAELLKGFVAGDLITIDTIPELIGQVLSGVVVVGDVRDFIANVFQGEWAGAALNAVGVIPAVGDAAKSGGLVAKFLLKFPSKYHEVVRYIGKYAPDVAKFIPTPPAKIAGLWKLLPMERGRFIEDLIAPKLAGTGGQIFTSNYPKIDVLVSGKAISIKSMDLDAKSYQTISGVRNTIARYAKSVSEYKGTGAMTLANGKRIAAVAPSDIKSRAIHLVVNRSMPADYLAAAKEAAQRYGATLTIEVLP